jgi:hypothetical protein
MSLKTFFFVGINASGRKNFVMVIIGLMPRLMT